MLNTLLKSDDSNSSYADKNVLVNNENVCLSRFLRTVLHEVAYFLIVPAFSVQSQEDAPNFCQILFGLVPFLFRVLCHLFPPFFA